jgi:glycosyltransferase involved in cell wall biosynthesis
MPGTTPHSLSIFFPAYNDSGTIGSLVIRALQVAETLTPDYEVIVVNDGSRDNTGEILDELTRLYPEHFRVVHHVVNRGYGGALRSGFDAATKDLVFYTDGDAQYDPGEVTELWKALADDVDWVNGWKISRSDPLHRIVIGRIRLMRRRIFDTVRLEKNSGVICLEMMKKFKDAGFRVAEVPVHHYHRTHGTSQFFNFPRIARTGVDVLKLWWALVVRREHLRGAAAATAAAGQARGPR